jgi:hypothetical protein
MLYLDDHSLRDNEGSPLVSGNNSTVGEWHRAKRSHEIFLGGLVFPSSANLLGLSQQCNITSQSAMRLTFFHAKGMGREPGTDVMARQRCTVWIKMNSISRNFVCRLSPRDHTRLCSHEGKQERRSARTREPKDGRRESQTHSSCGYESSPKADQIGNAQFSRNIPAVPDSPSITLCV